MTPTTTPDLHARLGDVVGRLLQVQLSPEAAARSTELLDALRELAEASVTGALPAERCQDEAALVIQRIEDLIGA
ncbi:MAG: hypothetical protein JWM80_4743 [Cyanobacteria bacterium RYN_339]|nr:hypothetical protein [Cyanobacteria bacterium RYN_339]